MVTCWIVFIVFATLFCSFMLMVFGTGFDVYCRVEGSSGEVSRTLKLGCTMFLYVCPCVCFVGGILVAIGGIFSPTNWGMGLEPTAIWTLVMLSLGVGLWIFKRKVGWR